MIILEGADGCGKSTLAEILSARFKLEIYHSGRPQTESELYDTIYEIKSQKENKIIDRVPWISDVVYNNALKRQHRIPESIMYTFIEESDIVIWCNPSLAVLNIKEGKGHKPEHYMDQVKTNSDVLRSEYTRFFESYQFDFFKYDYTNKNAIESCINYVEKRLH
jgi:adenylate kinase family enzyme